METNRLVHDNDHPATRSNNPAVNPSVFASLISAEILFLVVIIRNHVLLSHSHFVSPHFPFHSDSSKAYELCVTQGSVPRRSPPDMPFRISWPSSSSLERQMADSLTLNRFLIFLIDGGFLCFFNSALATHSPKLGLIFQRESSDSAPLGVFIGRILFCDKHALELLACGFLFCSALEAFSSSPAPA